ncbi:3342_t:CDS:2, partial [Scutellospora calospora]
VPTIADESDNVKTYNFFTKNLYINEIRYSSILIKYPSTSLEGIAIVYNISNWNNYNIQYNMGDSSKNKIIKYEYLGCKVNKLVRICTSTKVYKFVSSKLKEIQHTEVNENLDFYKFNQLVDLQTSKKAKTHVKYLAYINFKYPYNLSTYENEIDIILLEKLFKEKPVSLKRKEKIIKLNCDIKFIKLILLDLKITLFVVLVCKGVHTHLVSPLINILTEIQANLEHIINEASQIFE